MGYYTELRKLYPTEWHAWYMMHKRCEDNEKYYLETTVCEDWQGEAGFEQWLDDLGPKPDPSYCLSRINKFGDYEPGNVEWTTKKKSQNEQRRHTSETKSYWGKVARNNGIKRHTYYRRIYQGWDYKDAATLPPSQTRYKTRIT